MMMMGLHFMKDVPFPTVYIHALVRDEKGAKMSKSKGNVIDPLHLIDDYGADALRFTLAAMAAQGRDIKLAASRVEGYRNFATKLWNACRFAEMNGCVLPPGFDPTGAKQTLNRWIAHETARATKEITEAIEAYRFNDAAGVAYRFVWNVYCDWYLELAKPVLMGEDGDAKTETRAMVAWARDEILKLLHPFMPFITEELWAVTARREGLLVLAEWPRKAGLTPKQLASISTASPNDALIPPVILALDADDFSDPAAEAEIGWVVDLVTAIRSVRAEMNITPATLTPLVLAAASAETKERAQRWSDVVKRMARLAEISFADRAPEGAVQLLVRGEVAALPLKGVIDLAAEKARLDKELAKAEADIKRVDAKLGNEKFVANAPEDIVEEEKEKREAAAARKAKILEALERLKNAAMGDERLEQLRKVARDLRTEMEQSAQRIRGLVLAQSPHDLLGYLWSHFHMAAVFHREDKPQAGPDRDLIKQFQFVFEYIHAVWSSHSGEFVESKLDEGEVGELLSECEKLNSTAMSYAMASSQLGEPTEFGEVSADLEFQAKSAWVLIRGHRYQVLEEEFFQFVLEPHDEALRKAYGVGAAAVAEGIQSIAHSIRGGYGAAIEKMHDGMEASQVASRDDDVTLEEAIEKIKGDNPAFPGEMAGAFSDLFRGGICNLSRHTKLPTALLEDLAYEPGAENQFFADGDFCGTPYRTLPARIRPVVRLSDGYYATDGQFVRDSAYRAIQRGLIARLPDYREGWNKNQKGLTEQAFPKILSAQIEGATLYEEVYFKDPSTGEWAETDLVGIVDDTIFIVEAKAGVMAMHSPATNFDRHIRTIRELVLKAYRQCKRFLEYLSSGDEMPVYRLTDGKYEEVSKLRLKDFRRVLPIGLTVEAFTPFSAMCKQIPEVAAILGAHPFISMSVDDLFVLNRFLPTTGELFHYLEVRQAVAGLPKAMMFDEIDHLGAYVTKNRFDQDMEEQLKKADLVFWDSFSEVVDRHFAKEDWQTAIATHQTYPTEVAELLEVLNRIRPKGWLAIDAYLRNFGEAGRNNLAKVLRDLRLTLKDHPVRRFLFGDDKPVQLWLTCDSNRPNAAEIRRHGEIACLIAKVPNVPTLVVNCDQSGKFESAASSLVSAPPIIRGDYAELSAEAEHQRSRYISIGDQNAATSKKR
jgi:Skp family chaperone for outer membrane proteins